MVLKCRPRRKPSIAQVYPEFHRLSPDRARSGETRFRFRPSTRKAKSWWHGVQGQSDFISELPRCLLAMGAAHIGVNGLACLMTFAGRARRNRWERWRPLGSSDATGGEACFTLGMERRHARRWRRNPTPSGASARMRSSSASRTRTRRSKAHCVSSSGRAQRLCHLLRSARPRTRIGLLRSCAGTTISCRSTRRRRRVPPACQRWRSINRRLAPASAQAQERRARMALYRDLNADVSASGAGEARRPPSRSAQRLLILRPAFRPHAAAARPALERLYFSRMKSRRLI